LIDDVGPWSEYEIVDGHEKNDVVGIRKTSDGPNGKVFTMRDWEALPNYLLDGYTDEMARPNSIYQPGYQLPALAEDEFKDAEGE